VADEIGKATHLGERGKIRGQKDCRAAAGSPNLVEQLLTSVAIAPMDQDARALIGQLARHTAADAVGRPGDQYGLVFEIHTSSPMSSVVSWS